VPDNRCFLGLCIFHIPHTHIHTQHMYTSLLYMYINVCTYMHPLYSGSGYRPDECVHAHPSVRACVLLICSKNKLGMHFGCVIFKIVVFGIQRSILGGAVCH